MIRGTLHLHIWPQLIEKRITLFTGWIAIQRSQRIPFDALLEISAQANDLYTLTFVLYKIHMATSIFFLRAVKFWYYALDISVQKAFLLGLFSGSLFSEGLIIGRNFTFQNGLGMTIKTA